MTVKLLTKHHLEFLSLKEAAQNATLLDFYNFSGELCLSGNHTVTEYEMSGEPYSQKSGWIIHSNERIFKVMTFK